jgi:hypothetical protein
MKVVVNFPPWLFYPQERASITQIIIEGGWLAQLVWILPNKNESKAQHYNDYTNPALLIFSPTSAK